MAITHFDILIDDDAVGLAAKVTTAIAAGWDADPAGYKTEGNYHYQAVYKGSPTRTTVDSLEDKTLAVEAGAGITTGVGTVYATGVRRVGNIYTSEVLVDLTGLSSSTTDLDIIGTGALAAHIGQVTAARNGTVLGGVVECLEAPVGGVTDIDLYAATEGTGAFDTGIGTLTETAIVTSGGAWTIGQRKYFTGIPAANSYLYLCGGAAGTAAAYTAGKYRISMWGYEA